MAPLLAPEPSFMSLQNPQVQISQDKVPTPPASASSFASPPENDGGPLQPPTSPSPQAHWWLEAALISMQ